MNNVAINISSMFMDNRITQYTHLNFQYNPTSVLTKFSIPEDMFLFLPYISYRAICVYFWQSIPLL